MSVKWTGGSIEAAIDQVVYPQVRDNVAKILRATRCPEHGTGPTSVTITGHNMDTLGWRAEGCCDKLTEAMKAAIGATRLPSG